MKLIISPYLYLISVKNRKMTEMRDTFCMAEGEGFEPPERFRSPVFKTGAISQTLPLLVVWRKRGESNSQGATNARLFSRQLPSPIGLPLHCLAPVDGIEPPLRVLETPVLPLHHTGGGCPSSDRTKLTRINSPAAHPVRYGQWCSIYQSHLSSVFFHS